MRNVESPMHNHTAKHVFLALKFVQLLNHSCSQDLASQTAAQDETSKGEATKETKEKHKHKEIFMGVRHCLTVWG